MTDEQIKEIYDQASESTQVGTGFYLDELQRRAFARASDAALEEAQAARSLAEMNMWVAIAAAFLAVVGIVMPILLK